MPTTKELDKPEENAGVTNVFDNADQDTVVEITKADSVAFFNEAKAEDWARIDQMVKQVANVAADVILEGAEYDTLVKKDSNTGTIKIALCKTITVGAYMQEFWPQQLLNMYKKKEELKDNYKFDEFLTKILTEHTELFRPYNVLKTRNDFLSNQYLDVTI